MKHSISELKSMARTALDGKWGKAVGFSLLMACLVVFIVFIISSSGVGILSWVIDIILSLLLYLITVGAMYFFLNISRGRACSYSDLFAGFRLGPDRFLIVAFLMNGISFLFMLPEYLLPGFSEIYPELASLLSLADLVIQLILTLHFALTNLLLLDFEDMGALEAMRTSSYLMKGNKGRYILLSLSFLGWIFLSAFTLFIGLLWVEPYVNMTIICFYEELLHLAQPQQEQSTESSNQYESYAQTDYQEASWQGTENQNDSFVRNDASDQSAQVDYSQEIPVQITPEKEIPDTAESENPAETPVLKSAPSEFDEWNMPVSEDLFDED